MMLWVVTLNKYVFVFEFVFVYLYLCISFEYFKFHSEYRVWYLVALNKFTCCTQKLFSYVNNPGLENTYFRAFIFTLSSSWWRRTLTKIVSIKTSMTGAPRSSSKWNWQSGENSLPIVNYYHFTFLTDFKRIAFFVFSKNKLASLKDAGRLILICICIFVIHLYFCICVSCKLSFLSNGW